MKKRIYYPYIPRKPKSPRPIKPAFLDYVDGSGMIFSGIDFYETNGGDDLALSIRNLPGLYFAYDLSFMAEIMPSFIKTFTKISYVGSDSRLIVLESEGKKYFISDMQQFFMKTLSSVCKTLGIKNDVIYRPGMDTRKHLVDRCLSMSFVWQRYTNLIINNFGVSPSKTPGATALKTWGAIEWQLIKPRGRSSIKFARGGINGGAIHWKPGHYNEAYQYDINASYIKQMTDHEFPIEVYPFRGKEPVSEKWIATVKVNYKSFDNFSPLAVRIKKNDLLLHPQVARNTRVVINHVDYKTLVEHGELEIVEWVEGLQWFEEFPIFRKWGNLVEKISSSPVNKLLLKITSRALHSKFAQKSNPFSEIVQMTGKEAARANGIREFYPLDEGLLAVKIQRKPVYSYRAWIRPDWEALILSHGRAALYRAMDKDTIYTDTDSIISTTPREDLPISDKFGDWKMENVGTCSIVGPRAYTIGDKVALAGASFLDHGLAQRSIEYTSRTKNRTSVPVIDNFVTQKHSIRWYNYPYTEVVGNLVLVTQSPTRQEERVQIKRFIS